MLGESDPPAFQIEDHGAAYPALVVCDHASNAIPVQLARLGLGNSALQRHIAWDIGAGALATSLAKRLRVAVVRCGYSRLVIDCNRHLDDPSSILALSDAQAIPGNTNLTAAARATRAQHIFAPYHAAIESRLSMQAEVARAPALVAVHSFTPVMRGVQRPWHCGILWDKDPRIAVPLMRALRASGDISVGDNEPYSGRDPADYTVSEHAECRGWPHVCIEVRQDLLENAAGVEQWSERLAAPLIALLANKEIYEVASY